MAIEIQTPLGLRRIIVKPDWSVELPAHSPSEIELLSVVGDPLPPLHCPALEVLRGVQQKLGERSDFRQIDHHDLQGLSRVVSKSRMREWSQMGVLRISVRSEVEADDIYQPERKDPVCDVIPVLTLPSEQEDRLVGELLGLFAGESDSGFDVQLFPQHLALIFIETPWEDIEDDDLEADSGWDEIPWQIRQALLRTDSGPVEVDISGGGHDGCDLDPVCFEDFPKEIQLAVEHYACGGFGHRRDASTSVTLTIDPRRPDPDWTESVYRCGVGPERVARYRW